MTLGNIYRSNEEFKPASDTYSTALALVARPKRSIGASFTIAASPMSGRSCGTAFRWQYTLKLPARGSVYEVQFDDWIHLIDERTALNKAVISKFGIRVGEVLLSFTKV